MALNQIGARAPHAIRQVEEGNRGALESTSPAIVGIVLCICAAGADVGLAGTVDTRRACAANIPATATVLRIPLVIRASIAGDSVIGVAFA